MQAEIIIKIQICYVSIHWILGRLPTPTAQGSQIFPVVWRRLYFLTSFQYTREARQYSRSLLVQEVFSIQSSLANETSASGPDTR